MSTPPVTDASSWLGATEDPVKWVSRLATSTQTPLTFELRERAAALATTDDVLTITAAVARWRTDPELRAFADRVEQAFGAESGGPSPTDDGLDYVRKESVRTAWLSAHGGEPVRLDSAAVADIAFELVCLGVQPTVDTIRYVNGGKGSPNVIHPAVRAFFRSDLRKRWSAPAPQANVPEPVMRLWTEALAAAGLVAADLMARRERAVAEREAAADGREAGLLQREAVQDARETAQHALVQSLQQSVERTAVELDAAKQERVQAAAQLTTCEASIQQQTAAVGLALAAVEEQKAAVSLLRHQLGESEKQLAEHRGAAATAASEMAALRLALSAAEVRASEERTAITGKLEAAVASAEQAHALRADAVARCAGQVAAAVKEEQTARNALSVAHIALRDVEQSRRGETVALSLAQERTKQLEGERNALARQVRSLQKTVESLAGRLAADADVAKPTDRQ